MTKKQRAIERQFQEEGEAIATRPLPPSGVVELAEDDPRRCRVGVGTVHQVVEDHDGRFCWLCCLAERDFARFAALPLISMVGYRR